MIDRRTGVVRLSENIEDRNASGIRTRVRPEGAERDWAALGLARTGDLMRMLDDLADEPIELTAAELVSVDDPSEPSWLPEREPCYDSDLRSPD
jgi:hypothetical protein